MTAEEKVETPLLHLHHEVKIPYEENNGLPGRCAECSKHSYVWDTGGGAVAYPCETVKVLLA